MKLGLIADIHGNLSGLESVLANLDQIEVDEIVCLGDVAVLGAQPNAVVDLLRKRNISTVCGNTDAWLVPGHSAPSEPPDSTESKHFTEWTRHQLSPENVAWLKQLPLTRTVAMDTLEVLCVHGTPLSTDGIMTRMEPARVVDFGATVIVGGHTHQQTDQNIGSVRYVNPGSAGLPGVGPGDGIPIHKSPAWVEFAVLDDDDGELNVSLHRISISLPELIARAADTDMPYQNWWRTLWA